MYLIAEVKGQEVHAVRDRADQQTAEKRRPYGPASTKKAGPADDRRRNCLKK